MATCLNSEGRFWMISQFPGPSSFDECPFRGGARCRLPPRKISACAPMGPQTTMKIDQKIDQNFDVFLVSFLVPLGPFLVPLGPLLASLLGGLWGLWGAQVGSSWLPKVSWTRSGLQNASLQNYHVFLCFFTHSGLLGLPKTGQERPEKGPRSIQDGIRRPSFRS